jgi:putative glutathione S-transferase
VGQLVDGVWLDEEDAGSGGRFIRQPTRFRNWVTADGRAGPTGAGGFAAERDRYHLYVSLACPWAHRTLIFRRLKRLEAIIPVSVVSPLLRSGGWSFVTSEGSTGDPVNGAALLADLYRLAQPRYSGKVTVPVLWDKQRRTIVNNESAEIIRMFNSAFAAHTDVRDDFYPMPLRSEIDKVNDLVYSTVNNGVYRAGFATTQEAYDEAFVGLFGTLDRLEQRLSRQRYLVGDRLTEADWRLFTTLVRFDVVYYCHFKCNKRRIAEYAQLSNYLRDLYQMPGIAETVNLDHIKRHYYGSHRKINPTGIVPLGPEVNFAAPHDRRRFAG